MKRFVPTVFLAIALISVLSNVLLILHKSPDSALVIVPPPLSDAQRFPLYNTERSIAAHLLGNNDPTEANARVAETLRHITKGWPNQLETSGLSRIHEVMKASFPTHDIAPLLAIAYDYHRYQQAIAELNLYSPNTLNEDIEFFQQHAQLQQQFFGKATSEKLFGREWRLRAAMLSMRKDQANGL